MPRDAEAWLAERGITREAIRLTPTTDEVATVSEADAAARRGDAPGAPDDADASAPGEGAPGEDARGEAASTPVEGPAADGPAPSNRIVRQLAAEQHDEAVRRADERATQRPVGGPSLADDTAEALQFVRRSTATAPQSVGRLRRKLADRGTPEVVIDAAIERAHAERLVDDDAMVAALVEERRAKGHAPLRLRTDLVARGFDRATIDRALASAESEDPEAAAFAVARDRADRLTAVAPETAVRRIVGHLARRGYPEGLARKVAREAVDVSRDPARSAGR